MTKILLTVMFACLFLKSTEAQTFTRRFGGSYWDGATSLIQTTDGGYAMAGYKYSKGAGRADDLWLVKVDRYGNKQWDKTYGGSKDEKALSLIQTTDGGYAMAGYTYTYSKRGVYYQEADFWLVKVDSKGNKQWDKTYGGVSEEKCRSLIQTTDGGYAMVGHTWSDKVANAALWLVKVDRYGNKQWDKTFGWGNWDEGKSLVQTTDGGYAMAGWTKKERRIRVCYGNADFWLVKVDRYGNKQWEKTFGGIYNDKAFSLIQTTDGGYAMAGYTESKGEGYDKIDFWLVKEPDRDFWLVKVDRYGNKQWGKSFGGSRWDEAFSLIQTTDGGYAMAGYTESKGAGSSDLWLVKVDRYGNKRRQIEIGLPPPP